jgi:hypothetical protein
VSSEPEKTVAVIDDDPNMRRAITRFLSSFGYVTRTYDWAEITSKADCLIVDIELVDISGIEMGRPKLIAKQVATLGRNAFRGANNCAKKTLAEIEVWINKYDYSWGPEIARPKGQAGQGAAAEGDAVEPI